MRILVPKSAGCHVDIHIYLREKFPTAGVVGFDIEILFLLFSKLQE